MSTKTKTISYRKIMMLTVFLFVFVLFIYALLMNAIVSTGKKLTHIDDSIVEIQSKIMQAEKEMVVLRRSISKEEAFVKGFVEPSEIAYIKIDSTKTAFLNE